MKQQPWLDERIAANGRAVKDNFREWFGKSAVVDKLGAPIVLFHGTTRDFTSFDPDRCKKVTMTGAEPRCFFFSTSAEVAASYAGQRTPDSPTTLPTDELYDQWLKLLKQHGPIGPAREFRKKHEVPSLKTYSEGGRVIPVYVQANRLLTVNAAGENWNMIYYRGDEWDTRHLVAYAREKGYDGVKIRNVHDRAEGHGDVSDVYAFFRPEQIKSALGNSGLYLKTASLTDAIGEDPMPTLDRSEKQRARRAKDFVASLTTTPAQVLLL